MKNKEQPLISILMTAYNREKYIAEAIESVVASTYLHWELIIIDDCSIDNTYNIAKKFEAIDKRIKTYCNEENLGQFSNRNKAAGLAKGTYIKFLDSDDMIYPHTLFVMVNAMEKFPDAGICISSGSLTTKINIPYPFQLCPADAYKTHFLTGPFLSHGPGAAIIRRELFEKVGGFENKYGVSADTHFSLKLAAIAPSVVLPPGLIYWRTHGEQESVDFKNYSKMIIERYTINYDILMCDDCPINEKEVNLILKAFTKINSHHFIRHILLGKLKDALIIKKRTNLTFYGILISFIPKSILKKIWSTIGYRTING